MANSRAEPKAGTPGETASQQQGAVRQERFRAADIHIAVYKLQTIIGSGIFSREGAFSPLFEAAVTQSLIYLNDLVRKAAADGKRVSFTDDVDVEGDIQDVTDLITRCRNAACHIGSPISSIGANRFRFNVLAGKSLGFLLGDMQLDCPYDDDIAVFYGPHRLYVQRHLLRAFHAVSAAYEK